MQYTTLGKRGPKISTVGFGAWAIGGMNWGPTDDEVSLKAIHAALDEGVTFIDTADVYGFGHSEDLIAQVLKERGKGDLIIATKAGNDFYYAGEETDDGYGAIQQNYKKEYLIEAAEKSLKRLGVETLDVLQLHSPDIEKLEWDDPWEAMTRLKEQGKIQHAGLSIQSFKESDQAYLLERHQDLLDVIQVRYNLLERKAEKLLFPEALKYGVGVIVRIPMLFGLLSGKFDRESIFEGDDHRRFNLDTEKLDSYLTKMESMDKLYQRYAEWSPAQVALRFGISHPACHVSIPGGKTPAQVKENCGASDMPEITLK
ncbi:MAG: aldo/keto reductase [Candidatus Marinimicrobia bacterium]|jgi:aryl-alcohol dehydrogenase-like predicted oxidoreductase|nr:aldo/keto reductase [Candidatus Neomarinimicrobiota bacterium]MBT3576085.1 aldo/keto reductase [Candidatus Neomarinimicrobiota bacterium]MBT3680642.1 aldo/keto reductase [Candidatus Neomarinimicrobiota bacterium]MBT3951617.1 aldo/keto reductase [Candidatus Neomarinimicrobiota bacterium]MBT4251774.1 aldo/keto reductase [Candidatus Neomarinimicrobiota bacterium]